MALQKFPNASFDNAVQNQKHFLLALQVESILIQIENVVCNHTLHFHIM